MEIHYFLNKFWILNTNYITILKHFIKKKKMNKKKIKYNSEDITSYI